MRRSFSRERRHWYDNRTLLFFLILMVYPIGLIGIWSRDSPVVKKMVYSAVGLFGWFWFCIISIAIFAALLGPDAYEKGQDAIAEKDWVRAVEQFERVEMSDDNYEKAQQQLKMARQKLAEIERKRKQVQAKAVSEVKSNVSGIVAGEDYYSVVLYDMNIETAGPDSVFQHQYKVIRDKPDGLPYDTLTSYVNVSDTTFDYYANDLGMALLTEDQQQENAYSHPPGYQRYVGNSNYGTWRTDSSGDSFWEFYGRYAFINAMFGYSRPIYRYGYDDYRDYYRGRSPYYGRPLSSGGYLYGSGSPSARKLNPTNNFSSKVQSRVSRSPSRYTSRASFRSNPNNRLTRSSTRISRSPSRSSSIRGGSSFGSGGK